MLIAFFLIFLSNLFQTLFSVLIKGSAKTSTILLSNIIGGILFIPLWFFVWKDIGQIANIIWFLIFSGIANGIDFWITIHIYRKGGDVSFITPMMHAFTVICATFLSIFIGLWTKSPIEISPLAYLGYFIIIIGCFILPILDFKDVKIKNYLNKITFLCILTGIFGAISIYLDSKSIHTLSNNLSAFQKSIIFISPFRWTTVLGILPFLWFDKIRYKIDFTKEKPDYKQAFIIGFSCTLAYLLVCASFPYVKDTSYIVALRLMVIPMSIIGGIFMYKEKMYMGKTLGSILIIIGLIITTFG